MPSLSMAGIDGGDSQSTALLLALPGGSAGEENLLQWATHVRSQVVELPPIWVVCPSCSNVTAMVQNLAPHFQPFVMDDDASWGLILREFLHQVTHQHLKLGIRLCHPPQIATWEAASKKHVGGESESLRSLTLNSRDLLCSESARYRLLLILLKVDVYIGLPSEPSWMAFAAAGTPDLDAEKVSFRPCP